MREKSSFLSNQIITANGAGYYPISRDSHIIGFIYSLMTQNNLSMFHNLGKESASVITLLK